jgi:hypothetical protein
MKYLDEKNVMDVIVNCKLHAVGKDDVRRMN